MLTFGVSILPFTHFRYFQVIPGDNPSARYIYSVKDNVVRKSTDSVNAPKCISCDFPHNQTLQYNLPHNLTTHNVTTYNTTCTYYDAIFSDRLVNYRISVIMFLITIIVYIIPQTINISLRLLFVLVFNTLYCNVSVQICQVPTSPC